MVFPRAANGVPHKDNILKVVYDYGKVPVGNTAAEDFAASEPQEKTLSGEGTLESWSLFSDIKDRVKTEWENLPKVFDPISEDLRVKIQEVLAAGEP